MFITEERLKRVLGEILGIEEDNDKSIGSLKKQIQGLKDELADLKTKKQMEEREIKHLVKMQEEKQNVEFDKNKVALEKIFQEKELTLQSKYHDKIMGQLEGFQKEVLKRLPTVNVDVCRR